MKALVKIIKFLLIIISSIIFLGVLSLLFISIYNFSRELNGKSKAINHLLSKSNMLIPYFILFAIIGIICINIIYFIFIRNKINNKKYKILFLSFGNGIIILSLAAVLVILKLLLSNFAFDPKKRLFNEIEDNCAKLKTTEFLDYLSETDYSSLDVMDYYLVLAMREFNIALDPLYRGAPLQAIKNLNLMNNMWNPKLITPYVDIDANKSIVNLELELIYSNNFTKNNKLYFGRLNNSTPISFNLVGKKNEDYLILQDSVFDLNLVYDGIYDKSGKCILKDNETIKKCFENESKYIKEIFILSEAEIKDNKNINRSVSKYLDIVKDYTTTTTDSLGIIKSENCEIEENYQERFKHSSYTTYFVRDDENSKNHKVYTGREFEDANDGGGYGVRLAILVKGK